MTPRDSSIRSRVLAEAERPVTAAEADAYCRTPVSTEERADVLAQVQWFRRRYPTGAERLAYVRRAYRRWARRAPVDPED